MHEKSRSVNHRYGFEEESSSCTLDFSLKGRLNSSAAAIHGHGLGMSTPGYLAVLAVSWPLLTVFGFKNGKL